MKRVLYTSFTALSACVALGGTVIDTNLPAGSAIINVDGTNDGASKYGGTRQTDWYSPFSISGPYLEYTFAPGTYTFTIVNLTAAASMFPSLTGSQLVEIYTAWTYNSPWVTDWIAFDKSAEKDPSQMQLISGGVTTQVVGAPGWNGGGYNTADEAYNAAYLGGYYNRIVTGSGGRYFGTTQSAYTFASTQTLVFAAPDYYLPDNGGGISVLVTPQAVPEPASIFALAPCILAIAVRSRRKLKS